MVASAWRTIPLLGFPLMSPAENMAPHPAPLRFTAAVSIVFSTALKVPAALSVTAALTVVVCLVAVPPAFADESWYVFEPRGDHGPGEIGMQDWLDRPAGRGGRIVRDGDRLVYDGRPIKLWGINNCFANCAPPRELADRRARFYAKFGINSVRLHKFADGSGWAGILRPESAAAYDPDGLQRMDYYVAKLKDHGIYTKLSAHFGSLKLGPDDIADVPYMNEFGTAEDGRHLTTPHSAFFYSPELQTVHIRQMTNLLRHRNPHTGLTYAADPAIAFIEIINEQSILFHTSMNPLKASPTLRRQVAERFSRWLATRYGDHDGLVAAWGDRAIDSFADEPFAPDQERLDRANILPLGNPWYWDPDQLDGSQSYRRQRLLDSLEFLTELQHQAYDRYVAAIRETGYAGEIIGSNWQAGRASSHYLNLYTDYRVGVIDRHNYFGGGRGETFNHASMLAIPGSGSLSSGMQQVGDRPFMLSEWIHVYPNEWGVEGPAIIGAYGMGLQDWDVSYLFQNGDDGRISRRIGDQPWDATAPQVIGILPAVSRQVLRGDVAPAETTAVRHVDVASLLQGKLGFDDRVTQRDDVKSFDSDAAPLQTLAVKKCQVVFGDTFRETESVDLAPFIEGSTYRSDTGQLRWTAGESERDGRIVIDTPGTQAVVGFAADQTHSLTDLRITPRSPYAAIYVTAQHRERQIDDADRLLVVAIARARNTSMRFNEQENRVLERGDSPVRLEPVRARIELTRGGEPTVELLDHDGFPTGQTLPVRGGAFEIDGTRDRTPYYLIRYR